MGEKEKKQNSNYKKGITEKTIHTQNASFFYCAKTNCRTAYDDNDLIFFLLHLL